MSYIMFVGNLCFNWLAIVDALICPLSKRLLKLQFASIYLRPPFKLDVWNTNFWNTSLICSHTKAGHGLSVTTLDHCETVKSTVALFSKYIRPSYHLTINLENDLNRHFNFVNANLYSRSRKSRMCRILSFHQNRYIICLPEKHLYEQSTILCNLNDCL